MLMDVAQALKLFAADNMSNFSPQEIPHFLFSLFLSAALSFILSKVYVKFGNSLSNRKAFAKNFVVLAATTMFIITIVKTSLALSLGLVGALSIVRFRSAIKEPEELTYLFLNIAIGLGCGAGHTILTMAAFALIVIFIIVNNKLKSSNSGHSLYLLVSSDNTSGLDLGKIVETLKQSCSGLKLKRSDEAKEHIEASFYVDFKDVEDLQSAKNSLRALDENMKVTFMDTTRDY